MISWKNAIARQWVGAVGLVVLCAAATPAQTAQTARQSQSTQPSSSQSATDGQSARSEPPRGGCRLFSVSAYAGYVNMAAPGAASSYLVSASPWGSDGQEGGALSVGCERYRSGSSLSLTYEPSYSGLMRNSDWSALNHSASLRATRKVARKWDVDLAATGAIQNLNGFLFAPTSLSNAVAAPGSAANLANAVLAGQYSNQQLASALGGASGLESPLSAVLYGFRTLSSSASGGLTYRRSPRLSMRFGFTAGRTQPFSSGQAAGAYSGSYVQRTTTGTATASLSYSMNPRNEIGVEASESRTISNLYDSYMTRVMATVGRKIGLHWFFQGGAGVANINPVQRQILISEGMQPVLRGSAGYRLSNQSFMATLDREPANQYGTGSGSTLSIGGAWQWHPPSSKWELSADVREQRFEASVIQNLNGWMASGTLSRVLTRQTAIQISYSYMDNTGTSMVSTRNIKVHAVQFAAVWRNRATQ